MMHRIGNSTLLDLTLPGTHDSGAYELYDEFGPGTNPKLNELVEIANKYGIPAFQLVKAWALAQNLTFYEQMMVGVRYFDLRCCFDVNTNQFRTCHMILGNPVQTLLNDVRRFMDEHPTEIVFIESSHYDGSSLENVTGLAEMFLTTFDGLLYPRSDNFQSTISEMIAKNWRVLVSMENDDVASKYPNLWLLETTEGTYSNADVLQVMEDYNKNQISKIGGRGKLFETWWTLTDQAKDIVNGILNPNDHITSLKLLARIANWGLEPFVKANPNLKIANVLIMDHIEESLGVEIAKVINYQNCNDDPQYRARTTSGQDCRSWAEQGNCTDPSSVNFMTLHCPLSCGACPRIPGLAGSNCTKNSDCITGNCLLSIHGGEGICLVDTPKNAGESCGGDMQCWSGYCGRTNNLCIGRATNASCSTNQGCASGQCVAGVCAGPTEFKWYGTSPVCKGSVSDCSDSLEGLVYVTTSTCGNGVICVSGHKVLCSTDAYHASFSSFYWIGSSPNCTAKPTDCGTDTYILSNKCGDGALCIDIPFSSNTKVLCGRK